MKEYKDRSRRLSLCINMGKDYFATEKRLKLIFDSRLFKPLSCLVSFDHCCITEEYDSDELVSPPPQLSKSAFLLLLQAIMSPPRHRIFHKMFNLVCHTTQSMLKRSCIKNFRMHLAGFGCSEQQFAWCMAEACVLK
jgi:hypothetical protein